jgi:hypothetical protein
VQNIRRRRRRRRSGRRSRRIKDEGDKRKESEGNNMHCGTIRLRRRERN